MNLHRINDLITKYTEVIQGHLYQSQSLFHAEVSLFILIMSLVEQIILTAVNLLNLNHYVLSSASLSLQIFRGLQSFFYTGSTLYLLCLSVDGMEAADDFLQTWMDIHYKARQ